MTSEELTNWIAFSRVHPWGDSRADYQAATVAYTVYQMLRGKGSSTLSVDEFLLKFSEEKDPQTPDQMRAMLMGFTAAMGGTIKDRSDG